MNYELIKVCGMRDAENIRKVEALGIDLMGFIFWPKSSRYVSERPAYLPIQAKRVGVFVDEDIERVITIAQNYALDYIQLHGSESPAYIDSLRNALGCLSSLGCLRSALDSKISIIKAFSIASANDFAATLPYEQAAVDLFLFDTKAPLPGGNGTQFDWQLLSHYTGHTPFLLSGGIGPDDAERIAGFHHPLCMGIDLNSRFELAPALKDVNTLQEFITKVRQ